MVTVGLVAVVVVVVLSMVVMLLAMFEMLAMSPLIRILTLGCTGYGYSSEAQPLYSWGALAGWIGMQHNGFYQPLEL